VEGLSLGMVSSLGGSQLEGPKEMVGFLEVGTDGGDFVDQIFDGGDVVFSQLVRNDLVALNGDSLSINSGITSFVDKFLDGSSGGISKSDVGENLLKHVLSGFIDTDEGSVMDLSQSEQSEDLSNIWVEFIDTSDSDN